jgi:hypothetical protein
LYISPGIYPVSLEAQILDFVITEINFNSTGTAWCGDVEEISLPFIGCTGSPDIYCNLTSGGVSNSTTIVNNSLIFNRPNLNILAFDNVFTIQFYDADSISQDDNLGSSIIQFSSPGTYSFSTIQGNGTVTIETQPGSIYNFTDSVFVYSIPEQTLIFEDILTGNLIYSPQFQYSWKWLFNGDTIEGTSNLAIFQPTIPGEYSVIVFNGDCVAFSNVINYTMVNVSGLVHAFEVFPVPYQSGMLQIELNSSSTENIQLNLYDSQGKLLQTQQYAAGTRLLSFNPGSLSGGMYYLQLSSGGRSTMRKLPVLN